MKEAVQGTPPSIKLNCQRIEGTFGWAPPEISDIMKKHMCDDQQKWIERVKSIDTGISFTADVCK